MGRVCLTDKDYLLFNFRVLLMKVIYEPRGRAKEYSELACNWYMGCTHGCRYCFAPGCMHKKGEDWYASAPIRENILELFKQDAEEMQKEQDKRPVLFSFIGDPYQPIEETKKITRQILRMVQRYKINSKILTKGAYSLVSRDFDLMKKANVQLGVTVCFVDDAMRKEWEPNAAPVEDRFRILREAHQQGISTWVSLEPVIDPDQALAVIRKIHSSVDFWKVGKLNHMKAVEDEVDWHKFHCDVKTLLESLGADYYIKDDLKKF